MPDEETSETRPDPTDPSQWWHKDVVRHLCLSLLGFGVFCGATIGVLVTVLVMR